MKQGHGLQFAVQTSLQSLPIACSAALITYPLFYILFIRILTDFEQRSLTSCAYSLKNEEWLLQHIDLMLQARQQFESLFNIVPLTLFSSLFTTIPVTVMNANQIRESIAVGDKMFVLTNIFSNVMIAGMILLLVHQVHRLQTSTHSLCKQLLRSWIRVNSHLSATLGQTAVPLAIQQLLDSQFTGAQLFVVDQSIILSLLSAVITFSVSSGDQV